MSHFIDAILATLQKAPQAPAIVQLGGAGTAQYTVSYGALDHACRAIQRALGGHCAPGATLGLVAANSVRWIEADLALLLGGYVEVPVPLAFSAEQAAHLLSACSAVLTDEEGQQRFDAWRAAAPQAFAAVPCLRIDQLLGASGGPLRRLSREDRVCKVIHTSGTTSKPKGVRIREHGLDALLASLWQRAKPSDYTRYLNLVPFSLLIEQVTALYMPFMAGGCVVLPPVGQAPLGDPGAVAADKLALMQRAAPSAMTLPPSLVEALAAAADRVVAGAVAHAGVDAALAEAEAAPPQQAALAAAAVAGCRGEHLCRALFGRATPPLIAAGGAPVAAATIERLARHGIPVLQGYGLSENSSVVSWNTPRENRIGTVGKPLSHVECRLGSDGELAIRSASLFAGYSGSDPSACHTDADGWLWTGDLASIDADGYISIVGRKKNLIITAHGRNVSPEPAEASYRSVPGVADIVLLGEGAESLSAFVLTAAGADPISLRARLQAHGERWLSGVERAADFVFETDAPALRQRLFTVTGRPRRQDIESYVRSRRHAQEQYQQGEHGAN
ncbi:AMP-binding protein [Pseudoduganella violacea]|uniref:Long-subunit acyl-CoA synthetase (AMP-forming) n=1 Tax=Pseudoduganella violacea TaxID=1715466 RepID=A0A7W5B6X2_9BURK|nr:AMP-binding protein [Pseudoduganella violacea]MBB3117642.1 long-subunit acyl-CoA synthetase (AMP-forming) [Pseudoduganella violacea]